jgi:hypothetical protein
MHCALCHESKPLQKSHIIPEFMYGPMYDEKHRYSVLTVRPGDRERVEQKGAREKLLCRNCEKHISKFERYASLVIKGGAKGPIGNREGNIVTVTGINYAAFKLFLLLVVWRAGVARDSFFERVDLGPHQERLRVMIKASDPGPFDLYPCILWGLNHEPGEVPGLLIQPCKAKVWGYTTYHFVLPGFKLVFFVSRQRLGKPQSQFILQENGSLIFQVRSHMELPSLHEFMQRFQSQGRRSPLEA